METCATYNGKGLSPDMGKDMRFVISLDVNNKKDVPRAKFLTRGTMSSMVVETAMYENERFCTNSEIYVEEGIRDKLSPIMIHVNYSVIEDRFKRSALVPIVDNLNGGFFKKELKIWRDCGRDDQCTPDLQITSADISRGILAAGADDRFNVSVTVRNRLEPAYEAYLYVYTPKGMDLENSFELKNRKLACDRQTSAVNEIASYDVVRCNLGNPMAGNRLIYDLILTFATKFFEGPFEKVPIYLKVNSTNNETKDTLYDNAKNLTMSFSLDADIEVFAGNTSATYETDSYRDAANFHWDTDIGPAVNHTYELVNSKNSTLNEIQVDIYFPSHTHDGEPLLYIIKDIVLEDNHETSECSLFQRANINPNHYAIEGDFRRRLIKRQITEKPKIHQPRSFLRLLTALQQKVGTLRRSGLSELQKFDCKNSNCTQWKCTVKNFRAGFRLKLTVMARLWNNTMIKHGFYGAEISSVIIAQVSKLTYKAPGGLDLPVKYAIATTTVTPIDSHKLEKGLPWWVILLAILTGLALLILLILLLWRILPNDSRRNDERYARGKWRTKAYIKGRGKSWDKSWDKSCAIWWAKTLS
uniref:Integrin alpha-2 domain-containing protein n=1 Tax=Romanomermis culicivorax TaxID=13658 RepID=A0A915JIL6_ROMCU